MGFTDEQRRMLLRAWDCGLLNDNMLYGELSQITGLSRKQISYFARSQIKRLGNRRLPRKTNRPFSSIFSELPKKLTTSYAKRGKRFTLQQRKVLTIARERGVLNHTSYELLSDITGLSKKQISNWSRIRIKKWGRKDVPHNHSALHDNLWEEFRKIMETDFPNDFSKVRLEQSDLQMEGRHEKSDLLLDARDSKQKVFSLSTFDVFSKFEPPQCRKVLPLRSVLKSSPSSLNITEDKSVIVPSPEEKKGQSNECQYFSHCEKVKLSSSNFLKAPDSHPLFEPISPHFRPS